MTWSINVSEKTLPEAKAAVQAATAPDGIKAYIDQALNTLAPDAKVNINASGHLGAGTEHDTDSTATVLVELDEGD